jgi:hypothetical protein
MVGELNWVTTLQQYNHIHPATRSKTLSNPLPFLIFVARKVQDGVD